VLALKQVREVDGQGGGDAAHLAWVGGRAGGWLGWLGAGLAGWVNGQVGGLLVGWLGWVSVAKGGTSTPQPPPLLPLAQSVRSRRRTMLTM